jgi:DNA polymerase-3 subunit beta
VLTWTGFAVSKDEARPVLTGICMMGNAEANTIEMCSADGFRAGKAVLPFDGELAHDFEVIMPVKALTTLSSMQLEDRIEIQVIYDRRVRFTNTRFEFWLSTIEAKFPDVNQVIPTLCHIEAVVSKSALLTALKRVQAFSDDVAVLIYGTDTGDQPMLEVHGESAELWHTETRIPIELREQAIKIGFNAWFLTDIAAACLEECLVIGLTNPEKPALIRPRTSMGENAPLWILMPMHLS